VTWRWLPLLGVLVFVGVGFGWRTWWQLRRHGSSGIVLFRSGRAGQTLREGLLVIMFLLLVGEAVRAARAPEALGVLPPAIDAVARPIGAILLLGATGLMVVAQMDLGASWRIGIDEGARPGLVCTGLYRFCRNPIFLFMLVALAGFALLVPTFLSFVLLIGGFIGLRQHALEEERYLERTYGAPYRDYARRVGRFLPWMGRRP
jgi:protein-S-isoprenylcysteine O-methyltransferase Ste14